MQPKKPSPSQTYAIFPDYWKPQWGQKPLLGLVRAYNEFEACKRAYNQGFLRQNFTFEAEAVPLKRGEAETLLRKEKERLRFKL